MSTSIKKVVITHYQQTGLDNITLQTTELPPPSQGEVQIETIYAAFTGADANMAKGWYPMQKPAPVTPGYSFVGRVVANGPSCSKFQPGDLVIAITMYDSDAERINYPEKYLQPVAEGVPPQQACALSLDWYTAYGMVNRAAKVKQGQRVFVHGISGAVGFAVGTLCKLRGAVVYGTASERNHDILRRHGFEPLTYKNKDWISKMQGLGGVHAAFDALGFESFDESYSILSCRESSILVGYGANLVSLEGGKQRSPWGSIGKMVARNAALWSKKSTTFFYIAREDKMLPDETAELMRLVKEGKIEVPIKEIWDMENVVEAHKSWGNTPGVGSNLIRIKGE